MQTSEKQKQQQAELHKKLWAIANDLRGTMDASEWDDPPEDWWDADGNTCTNPEAGWYESQLETEVNYHLRGVTHWMPLPPHPSPNIRRSDTP